MKEITREDIDKMVKKHKEESTIRSLYNYMKEQDKFIIIIFCSIMLFILSGVLCVPIIAFRQISAVQAFNSLETIEIYNNNIQAEVGKEYKIPLRPTIKKSKMGDNYHDIYIKKALSNISAELMPNYTKLYTCFDIADGVKYYIVFKPKEPMKQEFIMVTCIDKITDEQLITIEAK
jgi:hypothetical protein